MAMHVKKGDMVKVIAGEDKGKTSKVVRAFPGEDKVIVEGINMSKKHQRARKRQEKGQIIEKAMPIHVSNLSRVGEK